MIPIDIVHIGDTHGRAGDPGDGKRDVKGDILNALDRIIAIGADLAQRGRLGAWVWPGDLFHTASDADTRNALQIRAQRMAAMAPVFVVPGNHDGPGELDVFERLIADHDIFVLKIPQLLVAAAPIAGLDKMPIPLAVYALPYPTKGALVGAGVTAEQIPQVAHRILDNWMIAAAAEIAAVTPHAVKVLAGHLTVAGAVSSVGQPQIGQDIELDVQTLNRLGPDVYVAMNHIHKHQKIGRAVYAGSITRMDYGELEPKGVVVAHFEADESGVHYRGFDFVDLDVPRMIHVEGELRPGAFTYQVLRVSGAVSPGTAAVMALTEIGRAALETGAVPVQDAPVDPAIFRGADVRVRYRFNRGEVKVLNVALIHAEFAEARSLKIEAVPEQEHAIRAPEVVAAPTVFDKLREFAERQGVPWSPELQQKAGALTTRTVDDWKAEALAHVQTIGAGILPE